MDVVAIIPARGGSKEIPRKNLIDVGGQPLIVWTIQAALGANSISRVIVSTDDDEIAECARTAGADVPFLRPKELAADEIHAVHAILHALTYLEDEEGVPPQYVAMLLPTAPLRTSEDIDGCAEVLRRHPDCSAISATPLSNYLTQLRRIKDGTLEPVAGDMSINTQRQDAETLYAANGAIFMSKTEALRNRKNFHHPGAQAYIMPRERSIDIDTNFDLQLVRHLVQAGDLKNSPKL